MNNYDFQNNLKTVWDKAVELYRKGQRDASSFFDQPEAEFLQSIGASSQEIYDFAEDFVGGGEPDFTTFALIHNARRRYFIEEQKGVLSDRRIVTDDLPPKKEAVQGIEWLPRIIPKAWAKLRGEMPSDLMYCCGGDRRFFKEHDIHPAEFLDLAWKHENDDGAIVEWVKQRSEARQESVVS